MKVAVCESSAWRLKLPADAAFAAAHPKLAAFFASFWVSKLREAVQQIKTQRESLDAAG